MVAAAESDPAIAARVKLFQYRVLEELYDFQADPDALHNLASDQKYKAQLDAMRAELRQWMARTQDPALEAFDNRGNPEALAKFMESQAAAAGAGKAGKAGKAGNAKANKAKAKKNASPQASEDQ